MSQFIRTYMKSDGDGHWYLIPRTMAQEFDDMLEEAGKTGIYEGFILRFNDYQCDTGVDEEIYMEEKDEI